MLAAASNSAGRYAAPKDAKISAGVVHIDVIEGRNLHATEPYVKVYIVEKVAFVAGGPADYTL